MSAVATTSFKNKVKVMPSIESYGLAKYSSLYGTIETESKMDKAQADRDYGVVLQLANGSQVFVSLPGVCLEVLAEQASKDAQKCSYVEHVRGYL